MIDLPIVTEEHILAAIALVKACPDKHDQSNWGEDQPCGTPCCVWGHACQIAGRKIAPDPSYSEIEDTPRAQKIRGLVYCSSPDIIRVMEAVDENGVIQLAGADLSGIILAFANLTNANLQGADLHDADLQGADLRGANLKDANLQGAELHGAVLYNTNLDGAIL